MPAGVDGDLELGPDTVGRRHQHGIGKTRRLEVEQAAEAADLGIGARPGGGAHQRLDQIDHAVAGIDVDAGLGIGEALVRHGNPRIRARLSRTWESRTVQRLDRRYTRKQGKNVPAQGRCVSRGAVSEYS